MDLTVLVILPWITKTPRNSFGKSVNILQHKSQQQKYAVHVPRRHVKNKPSTIRTLVKELCTESVHVCLCMCSNLCLPQFCLLNS
ncbi:hypothetical protein DUNSADRAFT_8765 [Dunaliella salina]|uniref:Encoded protein n=1 Tax=Dunaliella salina TaxID=3046 RepID=A0ABQ7GIR9_DUNSA|nr:hypothetical protein DUNSADRAFT_8765 [Dunaliella salina]|eukprot:KAF5834514.1 hypothetical protein DUNSADRAFT_8765 [Dunaliella salina]